MRTRVRIGAATLAVLLAGCEVPPEIGVRYRAERDLVRANREARRLAIQPQRENEAAWRSLATRFEGIASKYVRPSIPDDGSKKARATHEIRLLVARAHVSAAEIYGVVRDTTRMMERFESVATGFVDLPQMTAEVALARGRIAEMRGDWKQALTAYQIVVDTIDPAPGEPGVAGSVVDLPLQIARLQARTGSPDYDTARRRYEEWIAVHPGSLLELDARARLVDVAADRGELQTAIDGLRVLESKILASGTTARDPAGVRFAIALLQSRDEASRGSSRATLLSLLKEYPKSSWTPQALMALAAGASQAGAVDEALGYLDRIRTEHANAPEMVAQSLLARGRLLEQDGRWPEALETFRSLPVEQPTSEAALLAPLEIVAHYSRVADDRALQEELTKAEQHYRDFIARFPPGQHSLSAQTKLVRTLVLQKRYDDAISELVDLGEQATASPRGAGFLIDAARMAFTSLNDSTRAVEILERASKLYPNTQLGRWASAEATRLREVSIR